MAEIPSGRRKAAADRSVDEEGVPLEKNLGRIAHMFKPHRSDPLMRELCRLAIKCAQERLIN